MAGFVDDITGERLRGITALLQQCFWPTYNYRRATRGVAVRGTTKADAPRGKMAGLRRGSRVDAEVCAAVNRGVQPEHPYARKVCCMCASTTHEARRAESALAPVMESSILDSSRL